MVGSLDIGAIDGAVDGLDDGAFDAGDAVGLLVMTSQL